MIDFENFDKDLIENICEALNITVDDIESFDRGLLVLTDGKEYSVFETYDDAYNAAVDLAKDILIDNLDYKHLKQFIDIDSAIDTDWFESALRESVESYVEDIRDEWEDEDKTRLDVEMEDAGCDDEDEFIDYLVGNAGDPIEWYECNFGDIHEVAYEHNLFDYDKIAKMCVDCDGAGNFIASYDGEEIEYNGIYLYREN